MGEDTVIYINTALLVLIVTMLVAFGRWLVAKIHALDLQVGKNCVAIDNLSRGVEKNTGSVGELRLGLAVHAASAHCGEEN